MKRTPKSNTKFLERWYKPSTIPRLEDYGYKTKKQINECPIITEWLDLCYNAKFNTAYVQDHLFRWITIHQEIILLRKTLTNGDATIKFIDFLRKNHLLGEYPSSKS
jgi:hypothetical protein